MAKQETSSKFQLAASVTHLLHRAQQVAVTISADDLAEKGLTIRQFAVLAALYEQDGQSQSGLVDMTGIDRSTLADMVARMEKSGLVNRETAEDDARAKAVSLTPEGEKAYYAAAPLVAAADAALLRDLRPSRRASLIESLATMAGETALPTLKPAKSDKKKKKKKKK